jgi:hypothetical protein
VKRLIHLFALLNGTVIDGWLAGLRVHEQGQALDPAGARFVGSIQIAPATASAQQ